MKTRFLGWLAALSLAATLSAQNIVTLTSALPSDVTRAGTRVYGTAGITPIYYWVSARYPGGARMPMGPILASNTVGIAALNAMDFVRLNWSPLNGATGYDVIRQAAIKPFQISYSCTACAVVLNTAATFFDDVGGGVANWPPAGLAFGASHKLDILLDGISEATPYISASLDGGNGRLIWTNNWITPFVGILNLTAPLGGSTGINIYAPATQAIPLIDMHADTNAEFRIGAHGAGVSITENMRVSRGTFAAPVIVNNGDRAAALVWQGYDGAAYQPLASISSTVDAAPAAGDMPGRITFSTTADGSAAAIEHLRIANDGTITATSPLFAVVADAANEIRLSASNAGAAIAGTSVIRKSRGSTAAPGVVVNADTLGSIVFQGYDSAAWQPAASIVAAVDAAAGVGDMPGSLSFRTTPDAAAAAVERVHIDNAGITTALFEVQVSSVAGGYLDWSTHAGTVRAVRSLVSSTFTGGGPTTSLYGGDFRARSLVGAAPGIIIGTHGYADTGAGTVGTDVLYGVHGEAAASVGIVGGASGVRGDMLISGTATMAGPAQSAFGVKGYFDDALGLSIPTNFTAAVVGWITDRNTVGPTGAVIAFLDGGGVRTAPNNPTSAFRVVDANAAAGVGFQYGLDLYWTNGAGLNTVLELADIRGQNADTISNSAAGTWRLQRDNALEIQQTVHSAVAPATSAAYNLRRSRGTAAAEVIVVNADTLGSIVFQGNNGVAATYLPAASIVAGVDNVPGAADMPGNLVFSVTLDGAAAVTERLRIANTGTITATTAQTIVVNDAAADVLLSVHNAGAAVAGTSTIRRSRGTAAADTIVVNGDTVGSLIFSGNNGVAATYLPAASIVAGIDEVPGAADMPGNLVFSTTLNGAAAVTERLRISNAGTITATSAQTIQVQDAAADSRMMVHNAGAAVYGTRTFRRSEGTAAAPTIVALNDTVGGVVWAGANNNAAPTYLPAASIIAEIDAAVAGGGAADMPGRLVFSTTPDAAGAVVERLRISNAGVITATTTQLLAQANVASEVQLAVHDNVGAAVSGTHRIRRSRGVIGTPVIIQNADTIGSVVFEGYDGAAYQPTASIVSRVDGAPAANDMPGNLVFSTTLDGALAVTERLRISNAGVFTFNTNQLVVSAGGVTTTYAAQATAGMGLPPILVTYSALTQAAPIAAANLLAAAPVGQYRASTYIHTTTADGGACTATVILGWTYNALAKVKSVIFEPALLNTHDLNVDEAASDNTTIINVDAGANITREVTRAGACAGASRFDLYITLERLL